MLEQKWFIQVLLIFDDNKLLKNNWNTIHMFKYALTLIMKKEHMKIIRKGLESLEDYGEGHQTQNLTRLGSYKGPRIHVSFSLIMLIVSIIASGRTTILSSSVYV